jgi:hypothetical protein
MNPTISTKRRIKPITPDAIVEFNPIQLRVLGWLATCVASLKRELQWMSILPMVLVLAVAPRQTIECRRMLLCEPALSFLDLVIGSFEEHLLQNINELGTQIQYEHAKAQCLSCFCHGLWLQEDLGKINWKILLVL